MRIGETLSNVTQTLAVELRMLSACGKKNVHYNPSLDRIAENCLELAKPFSV
jgi:hypothetical protein